MNTISLTPEEIETVATDLTAKSEEIDQSVTAADSQVSNIRSMSSARLQRDIEHWDELRSAMKQGTEALRNAGTELRNLAAANREANR